MRQDDPDRSPKYQRSLAFQKQFKIHFQDDGCGGQFGFQIGTISPGFDLQVTPILSFQSVGLLVQEKSIIDLQDSSHFGFLIEIIL